MGSRARQYSGVRACHRQSRGPIIAGMLPIDTKPNNLHRCEGGPLDGEWHSQGSAFEFDGRSAGLESGWYRLAGAVYLWDPGRPFFPRLMQMDD